MLRREFAPPFEPSSDIEFIERSSTPPVYMSERMPLLATFTKRGGGFVSRSLLKVDFPVETFLVVQDGDDQLVTRAIDEVLAQWSRMRQHNLSWVPMVRTVRHVIFLQRMGCAGVCRAVPGCGG